MAASTLRSLALVFLVAAHALFNVVLNPVGATEENVTERVALPLMGASLAQPVLFAIWAALGPGPAAIRIPLSPAASTIVFFATVPKRWNLFQAHDLANSDVTGQMMLTELGLFGVVLAVLLIVRKFTGWRIEHTTEIRSDNNNSTQFSLKYLLALTAVCAALLVIGRGLAAGAFWTETSFWQEVSSKVFLFVGTMLLALFPMLIIPLIVIARRPSVRALVAIPFLWVGLTWLAVEILAADSGESRADLARQVALLQAGAAAAGLASAIVVRCAGYRLSSRRGESSAA